jgi:tRNA(Ile)-lysidine synthase
MIKITVPNGKYVVAVSGGVDSMVLLDMLAKQATVKRQQISVSEKNKKNSNLQPVSSNLKLVVAHFNHGIRPDSDKDEEFVRQAASKLMLPFEVGYGKLGPKTSEERAREARYKFLNYIKQKYHADAIITAHHQDDLIETAIINLIRGTGRRGLVAITENSNLLRPLLHLSKKDILAYAKKHGVHWREDPTNKDERYLRNYVRHKMVPKLSRKQRNQLLKDLTEITILNRMINQEVAKLSQKIVKDGSINRSRFTALPPEVANEVLMDFLRQHNIRDFDKKMIERLTVVIKTAKSGTKHNIIKGLSLRMTLSEAHLTET